MGTSGENKSKSKTKSEKINEVKKELKKELKNEIKNEIKNQVKKELKNEIRNYSKKELKNDIKIGLNNNPNEGAKNEVFTGHKPIPVKIINKVMKSICKITIETNERKSYGTGFFLNFTNSLKYLITNYHIINPSLENENITIEIHNKKIMQLKFKNRKTNYLKKPKDIAMIEIKESDNIYKDIVFLDYDTNYIDRGYIIYENVDVFFNRTSIW